MPSPPPSNGRSGWKGVRRTGVAAYLTSIALGLATIVTVLCFLTARIRELAR